jgi:predicted DNA-binding mobile mystery protein A
MNNKKKLIRQQLDKRLKPFRPLLDSPVPPEGWIRTVRKALGMNARQLADRLGSSRQWIHLLERDEATASITLKSLRRAAECLGCELVYALVPKTSLESTVRARARTIIESRMERATHTMRLENQELDDSDKQEALNERLNDLVDAMPANLWDGP